jgi:hypothetical protein
VQVVWSELHTDQRGGVSGSGVNGDELRTTHLIGWPPQGEDKMMHFILPGSIIRAERMLENKKYALTIRITKYCKYTTLTIQYTTI